MASFPLCQARHSVNLWLRPRKWWGNCWICHRSDPVCLSWKWGFPKLEATEPGALTL